MHFWAAVESADARRCSASFVRFCIDRAPMIEMLSEQNGLANRDARSRGATMLAHIR